MHVHAEPASRAAWAAGQQGKFWEMEHLLFERQDHLEQGDLERYAKMLKLDVAKLKTDMDSAAAKDRLAQDQRLERRSEAQGHAHDLRERPRARSRGGRAARRSRGERAGRPAGHGCVRRAVGTVRGPLGSAPGARRQRALSRRDRGSSPRSWSSSPGAAARRAPWPRRPTGTSSCPASTPASSPRASATSSRSTSASCPRLARTSRYRSRSASSRSARARPACRRRSPSPRPCARACSRDQVRGPLQAPLRRGGGHEHPGGGVAVARARGRARRRSSSSPTSSAPSASRSRRSSTRCGRPARTRFASSTSSCRCRCTRTARPPRAPPSPRRSRASSGRCTTSSSRTASTSSTRTSTGTPRRSASISTASTRTWQSPETKARLDADRKLGDDLHVHGTPTIFIDGREYDSKVDIGRVARSGDCSPQVNGVTVSRREGDVAGRVRVLPHGPALRGHRAPAAHRHPRPRSRSSRRTRRGPSCPSRWSTSRRRAGASADRVVEVGIASRAAVEIVEQTTGS